MTVSNPLPDRARLEDPRVFTDISCDSARRTHLLHHRRLCRILAVGPFSASPNASGGSRGPIRSRASKIDDVCAG